MFNGCSSLEELNNSNFNTENASKIESVFKDRFKLKKINELIENIEGSHT